MEAFSVWRDIYRDAMDYSGDPVVLFLPLAVDLVSDLMKLNLGQEDGRHDRSG
jgi:hypothetical protein